ncbi:hypothetical protein AAFC00_005611 [Neodothiora populina]|uniref:AB hydrolase-1 domain-containing protein n=1 Tax=Neodothiora populina TaxID=2781224 RepID=A0ABR3PLH6_9PEZI
MMEATPSASDLQLRHFGSQREVTQRSSSQSASTKERDKASRASRHKGSGPHLISSIIASFEQVTSPAPSPPLSSSQSASRGVLPSYASRRAGFAPKHQLRRSVSLGVDFSLYSTAIKEEYGGYTFSENGDYDNEDDDEDDNNDDAAEFPIVPTSRRSHGKLPHTTTPSPARSLKDYLRSSSPVSRSSASLNGIETGKPKLYRSNSRLSLESWQHRHSFSQVSIESKSEATPRKPSSRKPSRDTLRPETIREERIAALVVDSSPPKKKATQPASPQVPKSGNTSPMEKSHRPDLVPATSSKNVLEQEEDEHEYYDTTLSNVTGESSKSTKKNPITDAIPLRVSSLNHTTTPPRHGKTKSKRPDHSKHITSTPQRGLTSGGTSKSVDNTPSRPMFEGLDDEDTTVRRIRELKQRREDRLRREQTTAEQPHSRDESITLPDRRTDAKSTRSTGNRSDRPKSAQGTSASKLSRRETGILKAHKVLGLNSPFASQDHSRTNLSGNRSLDYGNDSASSDVIQGPSFDRSTAQLISARTSDSVDAEPSSRRILEPSISPTIRDQRKHDGPKTRPLARPRLPDGSQSKASESTPPSTSHSSRSRLSRSNSTSLERSSRSVVSTLADNGSKSRRKSMSDARDFGVFEEVLQERRKSVTDSVENYLGAPRLSQKVRSHQDGRIITFSEVGDPAGAAVIVCVGMGLTRFVTAFYDDLAATLGLRLITLDRPGVGESEPYPERERVGPLSWPDDVLAVTQHLRITRFSLLAHSAGAIYALATALTLPHCIVGKVQLLAPWIPASQFDTFGLKDSSPDATPVGALPRSQRFLRVLPIPFLKAANGGLFSPSSLKPSNVRTTSTPLLSPGKESGKNGKPRKRLDAMRRESMIYMDQVEPEKPVNTMFPLPEVGEDELAEMEPPTLNLSATATPMDPELTFVAQALDAAEHSARERKSAYSSLLTERTWTLATRNSNPAVDLIVCLERHRDIGFRYVDIQRQITITHGSEDKRVPVENVRWIGEQINRRAAANWDPDARQELKERGGCEVRVLPGEGHGLMASPGVMADVLSDIARQSAARW